MPRHLEIHRTAVSLLYLTMQQTAGTRPTRTCCRCASACLFLAISTGLLPRADAQPGAGASPVVVSRVVATNRPASQSFIGTLVPIRKSVVGSAVDGRVVELLVDDGDAVSMLAGQQNVDGQELGQPMVQLETVSLDIELAAAQVELEFRQHAEEELKKTLPTEIETAQAAIEEIKARLEYSKADYERLRELSGQGGGVTRREIEEALSTFSSQSQLNIGAQTLLQRLSATREVRLLQASSRVEAQQTEIRRMQELKNKYTIRAPFAGYVTSKMTELGQWVSQGDQVMEIVQLDPIELVINVPQSYIGQLQSALDQSRQNQQPYLAQVTVESVPKLLEGEIVRIIPQADLRSRSFPVIIRLDNPGTRFGHLLKAGMLAKASLFVGREDGILLVKKDALVLGGPEMILYVASSDPQSDGMVARPVAVQTGASMGDWIQVTGAINEGDLAVIEGNERLMPGQSIQVAKEVSDSLPDDLKPR